MKSAAAKTISPLIANAALDREEIDLLWWTLSDWSDTLNLKISQLPHGAALMVSALEVVQKLRRLPSTAHAHIARRHVQVERISNSELRDALKDVKPAIWNLLGIGEKRAPYPYIFRIVRSLEGTEDLPNAPETTLHWCRDLTVELYLLLKLDGRIA